jgi:Flp pilus assembly protein TadG
MQENTMGYELMGRAHAALASLGGTLRDRSGQGTVEYVGLILLLAVVLAGVVKAAHGYSDDKSIAKTVVEKLKDAIGGVGGTTAKG